MLRVSAGTGLRVLHVDVGGAPRREHTVRMRSTAPRLPVAFIPHGGGPWPFVDIGMDALEVERSARTCAISPRS